MALPPPTWVEMEAFYPVLGWCELSAELLYTTHERILGCLERFKPQHGPCHPLDTSMILFHHIIQILHLADGDGRAVLLVITFDRGCIGVTAVNGDHFGEPVAADRLLQKPERRLCVAVLCQQKGNGL